MSKFVLSEKERDIVYNLGWKNGFKTEDIQEFIKLIKEDNAEGIRMVIKMYPHKSGIELASEIIEYLNNKVMVRRVGESLV